MIYYFLDRQMNYLTHIDTEADEGIIVTEKRLTDGLTRGTRLRVLSISIDKTLAESAKITGPHYVLYQDSLGENTCLSITSLPDESKNTRTLICEDLAMELLNGSATTFQSTSPQFIEYYINRELFDTGWEIGVNELGHDIRKLVEVAEETPLSRLQTLCEAFNCEMTFSVELSPYRNLMVSRKLINIHRKIGTDRSDRILYDGVDVLSIRKSVDYREVVTALRDTEQGFNNLETDDGQFHTRIGESIVYDRVSRSEFGSTGLRNMLMGGYNVKEFTSTASSPAGRYAEGVALLKELNQPLFDADVEILFDESEFSVGDSITIVDEDYNPPLRIKARILEKEIGDNKLNNKMKLGNYKLLESNISSDLIALQNRIKATETTIPTLETTSVREGLKVISEAKLFLNGKDITSRLNPNQFFWQKIDKEGNKIDWEPTVTGSRIEDDLNTVDSINYYDCTVLYSTMHYVSARYYIDGLTEANIKIMKLQTDKTITIGHAADTHYASDNEGRADLISYGRSNTHVLNMVESTHNVDYDAFVLNGDIHDGRTTKNIALKDYRDIMSAFSLMQCPFFVTKGNHCDNSWGAERGFSIKKVIKHYKASEPNYRLHGRLSEIIQPEEAYEIITRPSKLFPIVENPDDRNMYYYYDIPGKNFRMIILNAYDVPYVSDPDGYVKYLVMNCAGYREKQLRWVAETLKNTPTNYHVGFFQHPSFGERFKPNLLYYPYNYELLDGILKAFVTGSTFKGSYTDNPDFKASIDVSFTKKGTIAFLAHGHTHEDKITKDEDGLVNLSIGCSVSMPKKGFYPRELGTLQEDLWDTMVIDTEKRAVNLIRFGDGQDRYFEY